MKIAGQLMLPDHEDAVRLAPGWLGVEDGSITEVVEGDIPSDAELGGESFVVCPGFIDAHVHLPQFGVIGAHGLGLLDWLEQVTFPAELRWEDPAVARADTEHAIGRMLRCGTTGFAAYATVHAEGARVALSTAERLGVRAHIGQVLMDRGAPPDLCRPAGQLLEEAAALQSSYPAGRRVCAAVTPRFAPTCSEALLAGAGALAQQSAAVVQTHLAETRDECTLVGELFTGRTYTEVYQGAGLLTDRAIFGHGIYLKEDDHRVLADHGSAVAHCPTANSFLMSGRLGWAEARGAGVKLALGSDIGGGYEVSMVRVARAMLETAGALMIDDPAREIGTVPGAAQAWHQITAENARTLLWDDAGTLAAGKAADLVMVRPDSDVMRTLFSGRHPDPLAGLMFGWDDRWVRGTMVSGAAV